MKKLICALVALMMMVCSFAMAETVAPQFTEFNTTDATYAAVFSRDDIQDGVINNVRLFTEDVYDIVEVEKMAVGDTFEAEGKTITVESIETDQFGHININGGYDAENGYTLTSEEDTNGWTTLEDDDRCTYTERGTLNLELAENVTFTDSSDIAAIYAGGDPLTVTGIDEVTKAIMALEDGSFGRDNTTLRIEGGKVVEINRVFMP